MKQCAAVTFVTPKKYELDALWFGGEKAHTGFIFLHGLSSSAFAHHEILQPLVNKSTMALYVNNRGHDKIGKVKHLVDTEKGYESEMLGEAHEVFTDCEDDIEGAVKYLHSKGVSYVYLVGHSTGCQKAVYYLSRGRKQMLIVGVVLICPLSDYAYAAAFEKPKVLKKATRLATKLVKAGKPHELLPVDVWPDLVDAQRFLSLYTPDSTEEIFTYSQPEKEPETFQKVRIPTLVILAEKDEYGDRPMEEISNWFKQQSRTMQPKVVLIKDALHSLPDHEHDVAKVIGEWYP